MLRATGKYILIVLEFLDKTKGGIIIPDTAKAAHGVCWGLVHSVGPECPFDLVEGDRVLYRRHEGFPVKVKGKRYLAIQPKWVEVVVREGGCECPRPLEAMLGKGTKGKCYNCLKMVEPGLHINDISDITYLQVVGYD